MVICHEQALRKELDKEKEEHAAEIVKNQVLQQQTGELSEQKEELELQSEALRRENDALRHRAEALAQSAESLLAEKGGVQHQVKHCQLCCSSCIPPSNICQACHAHKSERC